MASGRIKGITIDIDANPTKLTESLKKVDDSLRDTQSKLKDVNKLLKLDPTNVDLLKQKQQLLSSAVKDTKEREKELQKALEQLKNAGSTEDNRKQQDALQRELSETTTKLKGLEDQLNHCSPRMEALAAGAKNVQEKTAGISTAAGVAATGMIAMAAKAASTADDLLTMSKNTGLSVEEIQKLQYASSFVDVSMDSMTGSIKKVTSQMASGAKIFDELGISITDQNGDMRDATDVWYEALEALSKIENETERDQASMELFGKSAMDMAGIIDDGGEALRQLGEDAEATGNILGQDAVEDAVAFNDQIDELKGKASQAFLSAGAALADTLVPALETLVDVITGVLSWFGNLDGSTQAFILTILGLVAAISPIAGIIATIATMATTLNVAMLPMIATIGGIVVAVGAAVAIGVALYKNWDTIKEKASQLWEGIKNTFENIKNSISEKLESAKEKVRSAIEAIKGFFNFKWELPKLKMPHFSITGSFSLKPPSVPHLSVDWYSKAMNDAYLLNGATIFGSMNGSLLGGGETGKEVILGLDKLKDYAGANVTVNMTVNAAPGQSEMQIARKVSSIIQSEIMAKKAVYR